MKKVFSMLVAISVAVAVLVSCASAPAAKADAKTAAKVDAKVKAVKPVPVTHKNEMLGKEIPKWVGEEIGVIEAMPEFKDFYVFLGEAKAENLASAELQAKNFGALSQFATYMQTRVQTLFTGAQAGDGSVLETYMENIVKSLSDASFQGFRPYGSYWVEYQYPDRASTEFSVFQLYIIEREQVKKLLSGEADKIKPDTEEKVTAKDRVKKLIEGTLPALGS